MKNAKFVREWQTSGYLDGGDDQNNFTSKKTIKCKKIDVPH